MESKKYECRTWTDLSRDEFSELARLMAQSSAMVRESNWKEAWRFQFRAYTFLCDCIARRQVKAPTVEVDADQLNMFENA